MHSGVLESDRSEKESQLTHYNPNTRILILLNVNNHYTASKWLILRKM